MCSHGATAGDHRSGIQQAFMAWNESSRFAAARFSRAGGMAAESGTPQHLGTRCSHGILEVCRPSPSDRRVAGIISDQGIELVSY